MSEELIIKREGEDIFARVVEMFKEDVNEQKRLMGFFKTEPPEFRDRMENIESTALGLRKQKDGNYFNTNTKKSASEKELKRLDKETDDAMLRQNPYFMEYKLKHEDGFIIPTDLQARIEDYKDNPNKFKRRVA
jgi:hypothetical protein